MNEKVHPLFYNMERALRERLGEKAWQFLCEEEKRRTKRNEGDEHTAQNADE